MRLTPTRGSDDIPFGASYRDVVRVFGHPDSDDPVHDIESYPKGRRSLKYDEVSVTIGSEIGVCGMGIRVRSEPIYLWNTRINEFTTRQFAVLLASHGATFETAPLTAWNSTDIFSDDHGILAYFANDRVYEINITIPHSCPSDS